MTAIVVIGVLFILPGLLLVGKGLRGRRLHERPICAGCGYELQGLPEETSLCPECGGDFRRAGGQRVGVIQRRRGLIWTGTLLVVIGISIEAFWMRGAFSQVDWNRYKPFAWLVSEAGPTGTTSANAAMKELFRRRGWGKLSDSQVRRLITFALDLQGDPTRAWISEWGDFIETERDLGMVTDEEMKRYARQAVANAFSWTVKTPNEVGQAVWSQLTVNCRCYFITRLNFEHEFTRFEIDDSLKNEIRGGGYKFSPRGKLRTTLPFDPEQLAFGGPRKLTVKAAMVVKVTYDAQREGEGWKLPLHEEQVEFESEFELVPQDSIKIDLVVEPARRPELEVKAGMPTRNLEPWMIEINCKPSANPTPIAADVLVRNDAEWNLLGRVVIDAQFARYGWKQTVPLNTHSRPPDGEFELVLRPNRILAIQRFEDITEIWGEEIHVTAKCVSDDDNPPFNDLLSHAAELNGADATSAIESIQRRRRAGRLLKDEMQSLIALALKIQGDRTRPWNPDWGDIIEEERVNGNVSDEDWRTYARQAAENTVEWTVRSKVELGERAPWTLTRLPGGRARQSRLIEHLRFGRFAIPGEFPPGEGESSTSGSLSGLGGSSSSLLPYSAEELARGGPRKLTAHMQVQHRVLEYQEGGSSGEGQGSVLEWQELHSADFEMVPAGTQPIRLIRDAARRPTIEFRLDPEGFSRAPNQIVLEHRPVAMGVESAMVVAIAADASIRFEGQLIPLGSMIVRPGRYPTEFSHVFDLPDGITIPGGRADLILEPSAAAAKRTTDLEEIWGETIEVRDLRIGNAWP